MAVSPSNTLLSLHKNDILPSPKCFSLPKNSQFRRSISLHLRTKSPLIPRVLSRTTESLSAFISELEREQQQELEDQEDEDDEEEEDYFNNYTNNSRKLSDVWREIQGQDDWVGLLDPLDPLLRSELIRYGEMAQACYDAFDYDPYSKYCGSCRFLRRRFFESLEMTNHGYEVTRHLYATTNINLPNFFKQSRWPKMWSSKANWIGYVAVSNDDTSKRLGRRDITIAWRGTVTRLEWVADLMDFLKPVKANKIPCPDPSVKVESGFLDLYTDKDESCRFCKFSAREQILTEVKRLTEMYANEEVSITITGHSLGSALAMLSAYDIAETGLHVMPDSRCLPVSVYSFSGPRVGNVRFKERMESLGVKVLRVVNVQDVVPRSPGFLFNEQVPPAVMKMVEGLPWCYSHVGVELALDHKNSPFLKETGDPVCAHNLEALLHLLDGYHGKGERFVLASGRDPALVNKASDFLKDHYLVPPYWRQDENKGMVRNNDGRWVQPERPKLDDHPPDIHHHLHILGLLS
ncbi:phospholipase A1-Igamma2, chloroplastic-like [Euphorbia lathyris]|uniref:phospholipase A1-Igamma2, chloroplastic-like n=1 Tax=Euphorbia lathyris TaxID=212925 RepID=UPI003313806E